MEAHDYVLKLPLEEMTLRKIAIILWNRFYNESFSSLTTRQRAVDFVTKRVQEKVPLLFLPSLVEKKLMHSVFSIVSEIQMWRECHQSLMSQVSCSNELDHLCWTFQGTVDYRKTAERLLRLERKNILGCFKLASLYCLDDEVQKFWIKIPEGYKQRFYRRYAVFEDSVSRRKRAELTSFWAYFLKGDTDSIVNQYDDEPRRTFYQYAFESAAMTGNKIATEYFSEKLTFAEREASLLEITGSVVEQRCLIDGPLCDSFPWRNWWSVVNYLLSQMSKDQQIEVFTKHPLTTLFCFLDCPWPGHFMKIAEYMYEFLSVPEYRGLLLILSGNRKMNCNYENLFDEFFLKSPIHFRNNLFIDLPTTYNIIHCNETSIADVYFNLICCPISWFYKLFLTNNSERLKLVLRNVNIVEREKFILNQIGVALCKKLVLKEKWRLLELFVKECELSNEAKKSLKNLVALTIKHEVSENEEKRLREKFLQLIDRSLSNKRDIEELESEQPMSSKQKTMNRA